MIDFAQFMKDLVIEEYSKAEVVKVVSDNLNIHKEKSFYEILSEEEGKKILEKNRVPLHTKACELAKCCRNRN